MAAEETKLSSKCLMDIIGVQTEIVQMGTDLGAVMATIAGHARRLTGATGAVVELAEGDEMVYHAVSGITESQLGLRLSRRGSLSGLCVELGQPLVCRDSEVDERVDREACRQVGLRSMIVVPLKHGDDIVGVLKVLSEKRDGFNSSAILILEMMSELIAASMFHAIRYEANELFYRATHDGLTGLANRSLFYDRLRQRIEHARRHEVSFGLLIMDIDGLKGINDEMGHRAGDALIKEFARRLKRRRENLIPPLVWVGTNSEFSSFRLPVLMKQYLRDVE